MKNMFPLLLIAGMAVSTSARAIPHIVTFSASAVEPGGVPFTGTVDVQFEIFGSATGSDLLFKEKGINVPVVDGVLTYELGRTEPLDSSVFSSSPEVFVSVSVNGIVVGPRTAFRSVPFAYRAETAETLEGLPADAFIYGVKATGGLEVSNNEFGIKFQGVTGNHLASSSVTTLKIADFTVTEGKLFPLAVTTSKLADQAVTSSKLADAAVTGPKLAASSVTGSKLAGTLLPVFVQPAGCGGALTLSQDNCTSTQCSFIKNVGTHGGGGSDSTAREHFWRCEPVGGFTICDQHLPQFCPVTTQVGKLLPTGF